MQVNEITAIHIVRHGRPPYPMNMITIIATGLVPTSGWTNVRLTERYRTPEDRFWEFDLVADPPSGTVLEVVLPVSAEIQRRAPKWIQGVRVHAHKNALQEFIPKEPTPLVEDIYLLDIASGWENGNA